MQHFFPAYLITIADLPRIKAVAARVFERDVPTQTRLEIIARGAGFKTYASFLAALQKSPLLLSGDQAKEEDYITRSVPETVRPGFYKGVSLTDLVAAGLAWPERMDAIEAAQQTPEEKLVRLKGNAGTDQDFLHFMWPARTKEKTRNVYISSIPKIEAQARFSPNLVVAVSPANQRSYTGANIERPWLVAKGKHTPGREDWIERGDGQHLSGMTPQSIQTLLCNARVCLFDAQDLADFRQVLDGLGLAALNLHLQIVKPMMLDIQRRRHGTFHYMATEASDTQDEDVGQKGTDWVEQCCIEGMFDMADQVMSVAYEIHRMATLREEPTNMRLIDPLLVAQY